MLSKKIDQDIDIKQTYDIVGIGTIGHIDHGKTTLTSAITRSLNKYVAYDEIDSGNEEKERGITINAKHLIYHTHKRSYTHVDCPGHADYIKNMIIGSSQLDIAILVVSALEGVMPQTSEHLRLINSIGVPSLVIFLNKVDQATEEDIELAELDISEQIAKIKNIETGKEAYPSYTIIKGSAKLAMENEDHKISYSQEKEKYVILDKKTNEEITKEDYGIFSIKKLIEICDILPVRPRSKDADFLMQIEGKVNKTGRGTVITGRVVRGTLNKGDEIEILGNSTETVKTTVTSIEMFNKEYSSVHAGHDVGILIGKIKKTFVIHRGVVAKPGTIKLVNQFEAEIIVNSEKENGRKHGFKYTYKPQFFIRSADVTGGFVELKNADIMNPGENGSVVIYLEKPQAIEKSNTFIIRESGKTVGVGMVVKICENLSESDIKQLSQRK